jgi:GAF domain-containing protein
VGSASTPLDAADRHKRAEVTITRFNNPWLPQTRSELALPMLSGDTVIGAMTVQSEQARAFDQDDITVLQSIADTLTAALDNVRLFQQTQQNLSEIQSLNRQYFVEAWSSASRLPEFRAYEYIASRSRALDSSSGQLPVGAELESPEDIGESEAEQTAAPAHSQEIPLTLREQLIGSLSIERDKPLTPEEQSLVDSVAMEAALALENVRLLEQSQRRAGQERLLSDIARQVRGTTDIDAILRYTVRELGQALSASSALIRLGGGLEAVTAVISPENQAPPGGSTAPTFPEASLTDQPAGDETKGEESNEPE